MSSHRGLGSSKHSVDKIVHSSYATCSPIYQKYRVNVKMSHAMRAFSGFRGKELILNLGTIWIWADSFTPRKREPHYRIVKGRAVRFQVHTTIITNIRPVFWDLTTWTLVNSSCRTLVHVYQPHGIASEKTVTLKGSAGSETGQDFVQR